MNKANDEKSAIVITAFGTTYNTAVDSLIAIQNTIQQAYPNTPVRFAFTSNIIRKKWHTTDKMTLNIKKITLKCPTLSTM